jgi:hypothetical protein
VAFQIKNFASITASIINHARSATKKVTDWIPGSVARTLVEAPAVEIEELYLQMFLGLREAIPVATYLSFGFGKLPPSYARGFVSVSSATPLTQAISIPIGTTFTTADGRTYLSTSALTWASGSSLIRIPIAAQYPGTAANVAAELITTSPLFTDSSFDISNALIANGKDAETDAEREARFAEYVASLSRGTVVACTNAAKHTVVLDADGNIYEYVTRTGLYEIGGYVRIYLYSSRGLPSADLIAAAQRTMDGYRDEVTGEIVPGFRAGGVRFDVLAMTERAIPFTAAVKMLPGFTLNSTVIQQLSDAYSTALARVQSGEVLHIDTLVQELLSVDGVLQIVPSTNSNIVCGVFETLIPSTFTITSL